MLMSNLYPDLLYTAFPDQLNDTYEYMQDMTADLVGLVSQYETLINTKRFNEAVKLLSENPSLNRIYFNAEKYNKIIDSIKALQRLYKDDVQTYILNLANNRGEYSSSSKYTKYNIVYYESLPYLNISSNTPIGTLPTNTTYWYPLAIRGEQGESGLGLTPRGKWNEYTQYYKDDLVSYNNVLWAANEDNIGFLPSDTSSKWYDVLSMNINFSTLKIQNSEIDKFFDGSAMLSDDDTGVTEDSNESITKVEIDNVLYI